MELTYFGHACLHLAHDAGAVLLDPFISGNPRAVDVVIEEIQVTDLLLTHGHQDHVLDAPAFASRSGVRTFASFEVAEWVSKQGGRDVVGMNHGGTVNLQGGTARMVAAIHSSTLPDGTPGGNPSGFVIDLGGVRLYHAGDTALTKDMELIGEHWPCKYAALPLGGHFTMDWRDGLIAAKMCGALEVIALHFDTFPPISIPTDEKLAARAAFEAAGIRLHFLEIGETLDLV